MSIKKFIFDNYFVLLFVTGMLILFGMTANFLLQIRINPIIAGTFTDSVNSYSQEPFKPVKVLFDYYHHFLLSTKVGKYITTSS